MTGKFFQALLGLLLLGSTTMMSHAEDKAVPCLVLKMTDAQTVKFALSEQPEVTFADGKLFVKSATVDADYPQSDVVEFYFSDEVLVGIASEANKSQVMTFTYNDNENIVVTGTKAKAATLYAIDGTLVKRQAVKDGAVSISLATVATGTYILNLENEHTFKIIKK